MEKIVEVQIHDHEMKWGTVRSSINNCVGSGKFESQIGHHQGVYKLVYHLDMVICLMSSMLYNEASGLDICYFFLSVMTRNGTPQAGQY